MTKEEQLKIYVAYLPYNVAFSDLTCDMPNKLILDAENFSGVLEDATHLNTIRLHLYDLSFLTKEIEHEGERFVPMLKLAKIESDLFEWLDNDKLGNPIIGIEDTDFHMESMTYAHTRRFEFDYEIGLFVVNLYDEGVCCEKDLIGCEGVCFSNRLLIDKLLEWHFNVFGIPAGEFIEKSTLKTESNDHS